jgi:nitrate reductase NapD
MSICSLVVHTRPENVRAVGERLCELEGVEVHGANEAGKLVVTVDHPDRQVCSENIMAMQNVTGVLSASLVYEHFEESEPTLKEVPK